MSPAVRVAATSKLVFALSRKDDYSLVLLCLCLHLNFRSVLNSYSMN